MAASGSRVTCVRVSLILSWVPDFFCWTFSVAQSGAGPGGKTIYFRDVPAEVTKPQGK